MRKEEADVGHQSFVTAGGGRCRGVHGIWWILCRKSEASSNKVVNLPLKKRAAPGAPRAPNAPSLAAVSASSTPPVQGRPAMKSGEDG